MTGLLPQIIFANKYDIEVRVSKAKVSSLLWICYIFFRSTLFRHHSVMTAESQSGVLSTLRAKVCAWGKLLCLQVQGANHQQMKMWRCALKQLTITIRSNTSPRWVNIQSVRGIRRPTRSWSSQIPAQQLKWGRPSTDTFRNWSGIRAA